MKPAGRFVRLVCLAAALGLPARLSSAQGVHATLVGQVQDAQGRAVAGAGLTVTSEETNQSRSLRAAARRRVLHRRS